MQVGVGRRVSVCNSALPTGMDFFMAGSPAAVAGDAAATVAIPGYLGQAGQVETPEAEHGFDQSEGSTRRDAHFGDAAEEGRSRMRRP